MSNTHTSQDIEQDEEKQEQTQGQKVKLEAIREERQRTKGSESGSDIEENEFVEQLMDDIDEVTISNNTRGKNNDDEASTCDCDLLEEDGFSFFKSSNIRKITADDDERAYKITKPGCVLIINNRFDNWKRTVPDPMAYAMHARESAQNDANDMKKLFGLELGCNVMSEQNVASTELPEIIKSFQDCYGKKSGYCVVIFMSHGASNNGLLMDDMKSVNLYRDLVNQFNHHNFPEFKNKPKIFFIQACDTDSEPDLIEDDGAKDTKYESRELADTFVGKSSLPFRPSVSHNQTGSFYIQAVHKIIGRFWKLKNLQSMHRLIEDKVIAKGNRASDASGNDFLQTPNYSAFGFDRFYFPDPKQF